MQTLAALVFASLVPSWSHPAACGDPPQLAVTNHGLAVTTMRADDRVVAFTVDESRQLAILNGDDDQVDQVLHVLDTRTGSLVNLGLATAMVSLTDKSRFTVSERTVVFSADESQQQADLNGDGDRLDLVVHVYGPLTAGGASGAGPVNLGLASIANGYAAASGGLPLSGRSYGGPFLVRDSTLFVALDEASQGGSDLDGDGDALDEVFQLGPLGRSTRLRPFGSSSPPSFAWRPAVGPLPQKSRFRFAFFPTPSFLAGIFDEQDDEIDRNGDGDALDGVAAIFVQPGIVRRDLGLQAELLDAVDDWLVVRVQEAEQGGTDLNGDGDVQDGVLHVFDLASGTLRNLGRAGSVCSLSRTHLAFKVSEAFDGSQDLNGDGDTNDRVAFVLERASGTVTGLGVAVSCSLLVGDRLAISVPESGQVADLNGDGDTTDTVLFVHDLSTGQTTNLGLALSPVQLAPDGSERIVWFPVDEADQGSDANGDGDLADDVLFAYDPADGSVWNTGLGLASLNPYAVARGERALTRVSEAAQGQDLNGDEDQLDQVVHLLDAGSRTVLDLGLAAVLDPLLLEEDAVIAVAEFQQGQTDLNGSGVSGDQVLHTVRLP